MLDELGVPPAARPVIGAGYGKCESFEGIADRPDLTVHTPDTVWLQIVHGKLDGANALADGLYFVDGDYAVVG